MSDFEDLIKMLLPAALAVVGLVLAAYFFVYIGIPILIFAGGWGAYTFYQNHPKTRDAKDRQKIEALRSAIIASHKNYGTEAEFGELMWDGISAQFKVVKPTFDLASHLFGTSNLLYEGECFAQSPPKLPEQCTELDRARFLDAISARATALANPKAGAIALEAITDSFSDFLRTLPPIAFQSPEELQRDAEKEGLSSQFAVNLLSVLPNPGASVEAAVLPFYTEVVRNSGLFADLRAQLDRNMHDMSQVPYTPENYQSPKLVPPSKYDGNPFQIVHGYLKNTALENLFGCNVPIDIPEQLRFQGMWIVAPAGRGKTTLLSALLRKDLEKVRTGEASIILMDSKGDLIDHARKLKQFGPGGELEGKLTLIEPSSHLALNPLDLGASATHTLGLLEYVFTSLLDAAPTPNQSTLLRKVFAVCLTMPHPTLKTIYDILLTGKLPPEADLDKLHPDDKDWFERGVINSQVYKERRPEIAARLDNLVSKVPIIRDAFAAPKTLFNIGREMDAGKVIIIDNSTRVLGEGAEFFARFFIALILAAAQQRAGREEKLPCYVYIDECQTAIAQDAKIATILDTCRSQAIALILAHQRLQQIKSDDVKDALANCAIRIANSDEDAHHLAGRMRTTPEELRSLRQLQFALFMRDLTQTPLVIEVEPRDRVDKWPKMTDAQFKDIQKQMAQRYCYTPRAPVPEAPVADSPPLTDTASSDW